MKYLNKYKPEATSNAIQLYVICFVVDQRAFRKRQMTDTTDSYSRFIHHLAKNMVSWTGRRVEGRYVCRISATYCPRY